MDEQRAEFEAWMRDTHGPGVNLVRSDDGYISTVPHRAVRMTYASVQMLWEAWQAARALPAQAGQVLSNEEIDAAYEKARADYRRSRFAVRGQQLTAQDSPDWWFARAIEAAVLAKRVPMMREEVKELARKVGYDNATAQERADFINGIRHAEVWHGIVGEKGGA